MGEEQPQADRGEAIAAQPPEVIDLRGNGQADHADLLPPNGSVEAASGAGPARPGSGRLTANEWWEWASLGQQITDLQHDTRRITGRVIVSQRSHVSSFDGLKAPEVTEAALIEPAAADVMESAVAAVAEPAVEAEPEVMESEVAEPQVGQAEREPRAAHPVLAERAPEIAQVQASPAQSDPDHGPWRSGRRAAVTASAVVVVVLVAVVTVALAVREESSAQRPSGQPVASGPAANRAVAPGAVNWLEQNTTPGTRLFVPSTLADDLAAGLHGRAVLSYGQTIARPGDLVLVRADAAGLPAGSLTKQVLASAEVVGRLPGTDVEVRQVIALADAVAGRRAAGAELVQNPALSFTNGSMAALRNGRVDERVLVILAGLASVHSLDVALPRDPADLPDAPLRTLQIRGLDGHPITDQGARAIRDFVTAQRDALAGPAVDQVYDARTATVSVRYLLPASVDLLSSGSFPTTSEESP